MTRSSLADETLIFTLPEVDAYEAWQAWMAAAPVRMAMEKIRLADEMFRTYRALAARQEAGHE